MAWCVVSASVLFVTGILSPHVSVGHPAPSVSLPVLPSFSPAYTASYHCSLAV